MLVKNKNGWYFHIKTHNEYIKGVIVQNIKLSFLDKLNILFAKGINIVLIGTNIKIVDK